MLNFVKEPHELDTKLDKWIYALKHLAEFKQRPEYLSGPEFDQLFNLAEYANLTRKERDMYNASLKYKWDNKNVRDYEVNKGREEGKAEGREEERAKAREEKLEMAIEMLADNEPIDKIAKYTKLSRKEIEALV
ncbi:PD-(D/E)XK nuclease family transposase [compost metagenome]